eukprot:gb/GECG01012611.1/.p1 GENE.gb/GECG01012611.1/~~gb/GECG01012611.1/.p1  ORF type:complete len:286 (+),score=41.52 gb/GECG01012611.1/:1-858(+)
MDFEDVGKQCALESCTQHDFMPIQCEYCKQFFCENHYTLDGHQCASVPEFDLSQREKDEINARVFQRAMDAIQRSREESEKLDSSVASTPSEFQRGTRAPQGRKRASEMLRAAREREAKKFGSSVADTTGSAIANASSKEVSERQSNEKPMSEAAKKRKQKVAVMKIKTKAYAPKHIAESDRVYFGLKLDESTGFNSANSTPGYDPKLQQVNICLSRAWQIGKAIDYVSEKTGVENVNNSTTDKSRLLSLVKWESGAVLEVNPTIRELLDKNEIFEGDTLCLKRG